MECSDARTAHAAVADDAAGADPKCWTAVFRTCPACRQGGLLNPDWRPSTSCLKRTASAWSLPQTSCGPRDREAAEPDEPSGRVAGLVTN